LLTEAAGLLIAFFRHRNMLFCLWWFASMVHLRVGPAFAGG
jgi:hypothetical protein